MPHAARMFPRLTIIVIAAACCAGPASPRAEGAGQGFQVQREILHASDAPVQSTLYSQGVRVGQTIYVTGMLGIDPKTGKPAGPTIQEQTRQALINCEAVLRAGGAARENVVEVQALLARPEDFAGLNEAYGKFFTVNPPIRSVARLGPELPGFLISIKMIAIL
jgi:2-iminobutanoate/2-iminopropanoate deaminase